MAQDEQAYQRKIDKQYKYLDGYVKQSEKLSKQEAEKVAEKHKEDQAERDRQEKEGLITKPAVLGRFKYSMRKTDF